METTPITTLKSVQDDHAHPDLHRHGAKVEVMVACSDLADLDIFSKTDPMCVLFVKKFGQWKEVGRTEAVDETLNPKFTETFCLDYHSELNQPLMFSVYDVDSRSTDLRKHDFVGSLETSLAQLIKPEESIHTTSKNLWAPGDDKNRGMIHVTAEVLRELRSRVTFHLGASKLDKKGLFSMTKTDTYCEVSRSINSIEYHPIYRTEVVYKTQEPRWRPFDLSVQKLCNGDPDRSIQFSCWHIQTNLERKLIGQGSTTLRNLTKDPKKLPDPLRLSLPKKEKKKSYKGSGMLKFLQCRLDMAYTLLDYVRGGCSIQLMVAIDFTSSNGLASAPSSLHYLNAPTENQYIEAIKTMGGILGHYDMEQNFLAFGFGAKSKPNKKIKDCFPLVRKGDNPYVKGISGIIEAYRAAVPRLTLAGPSRVAAVINKAAEYAREKQLSQDNQFYHVLMIITDGVVNDLDEAIKAVRAAAEYPLSIVMVGIGPADFHMMESFQHSVQEPTKSVNSKLNKRENFHFAALRKQKYSTGANTAIARDTLAKVSQQLINYMKTNSLVPNPAIIHRSDNTQTSWVSEDMDINGEHDHLNLDANTFLPTSPSSNALSNKYTGPSCPACGATIDTKTDFHTLSIA